MSRPTLTYRDIRKKLKKVGFVLIRGKKHEKWKHPDCRLVMMSYGNGDAGYDLVKIISSQMEISLDEFYKI